LFNEQATLLYSGDPNQPGAIRFGDFDQNGYPDILVTVKKGTFDGRTYLFENQGDECKGTDPTCR
jgi:hypothetical protein